MKDHVTLKTETSAFITGMNDICNIYSQYYNFNVLIN